MTTDNSQPIPPNPGPYSYQRDNDGTDDAFYITAADGTFIAEIRFWNDGDGINAAKHEANARLLTASWKLREALHYLLEQTVDMDLKYGISLSEGEEDARTNALAAIAKASSED